MMVGLFIELARRNHEGKQVDPFSDSVPRAASRQPAPDAVRRRRTLRLPDHRARYLVRPQHAGAAHSSLSTSFSFSPIAIFGASSPSRFSAACARAASSSSAHRLRACISRNGSQSKEIYGMETIGYLSDEPQNLGLEGFVLSRHHRRGGERRSIQQEITQVILLQLPESAEDHMRLMAMLNRHGLRLLIYNNLEEKLNHPVIYMEDDGHHFITLRKEPLENPLNRMAKRTLDIAVSLPVDSFHPARHDASSSGQCSGISIARAGLLPPDARRNPEQPVPDLEIPHHAHQRRAGAPSHDGGRAHLSAAASSCAASRLDELPQFINVLGGTMSVTGPRPHLIEHNEQFAREIASYPIRTVVKPGITGLAQVRGFRGEAKHLQRHRHAARVGHHVSRELAAHAGPRHHPAHRLADALPAADGVLTQPPSPHPGAAAAR